MIPLGSCTMKLNATTEMEAITWPWSRIHPFVPTDQVGGYRELIGDLERWLAEITGYDAVSLQPNAGSQGEYAGLLAIRQYHASGPTRARRLPDPRFGARHQRGVGRYGRDARRGGCVRRQRQRRPRRPRGQGRGARGDLLAALMVTYPSTHGVFEARIGEICARVHDHGGQVYLDGVNLNASFGIVCPGRFGADVSHINLHKTFCIPHGGGGPGVGPIGVRSHLAPFLPNHPLQPGRGSGRWRDDQRGAVGIGGHPADLVGVHRDDGRRGPAPRATQVAYLNANDLAHRLGQHYPVLYTGAHGLVADECIIDLRPITREMRV